jgi:hypothetical protein
MGGFTASLYGPAAINFEIARASGEPLVRCLNDP